MSNIQSSSDAAFDNDVLQADKPVLVDFWAPWCGPCKAIAPILDELAGEYGDKVRIVKINVDDSGETASKYNVRGIPSLLLFKDGSLVGTKVGALTKSQLTAFVDEHL